MKHVPSGGLGATPGPHDGWSFASNWIQRRLLCLLPARDDDPGAPPRRASTRWRLNRRSAHTAPRDHPRDHRVGVPHLPGPELITAPHRSRDLGHDLEDPSGAVLVVAQPAWALNGLSNIGNVPAQPDADLVPKDFQPAGPAGTDRRRRRRPLAGRRSDPSRAPARLRICPRGPRLEAPSGRGRVKGADAAEP